MIVTQEEFEKAIGKWEKQTEQWEMYPTHPNL